MSIHMNVVKATMYGTEYYLGAMSFASIDRNVLLPDNKHWDNLFGDEEVGEGAQRKLVMSRVRKDMVPYLLDNTNAFFNAITLIMVPMGATDLKEGEDFKFKPNGDDDTVGTLIIEDHVLMFPADGMHRSAAIQEALRERPELRNQKVSVLLVPFHGKEIVRQLFSDLNRNVVPVSESVALNFEIRDQVVVATKGLINGIPLFYERVNMVSNSLPEKSPHVIALNTLVKSNETLLSVLYPMPGNTDSFKKHPELLKLKGLAPSDPTVQDVVAPLAEVWKVIIDSLPEWQKVEAGLKTAGAVRKEFIFAFGLGWQALAVAAAALRKHRETTWATELRASIKAVDWRKGAHWHGIAMIGDRVNNTSGGIRATAGYILEEGGFKKGQGVDIDVLLASLEKSRIEAPKGVSAAA